jgi:diketogulonate reductase-like aldo/keto reductase
MQIHWPVTEPQKKGDRIDPSVKETWTAMEKLVDEVPRFYTPPLLPLSL